MRIIYNWLFSFALILFVTLPWESKANSTKPPGFKAITLDLAPWGIRQDAGYTGAFYLPMELIIKNFGYPVDHQLIPLKRALMGMKTADSFDLAIFTPGPHSKDLIDLGVVLKGIKLIFLSRKGLKVNEVSDIDRKWLIGTPRGISASTPVLNSGKYNIVYVDGNRSGMRMLARGRLDAFLETNVSISMVAESLSLDRNAFDKPITLVDESIFPAILYLNKKTRMSSKVQKELSGTVSNLRESGKLQVFVDDALRWLHGGEQAKAR